jgi:hypothetical protein
MMGSYGILHHYTPLDFISIHSATKEREESKHNAQWSMVPTNPTAAAPLNKVSL